MKTRVTKSNKAVETKAVLNKLEALYHDGIKWNVQSGRTNASLYILLAKCLGNFHEIKGKNIEGEVIKTMSAALIERDFTVPKHPRVINLIVRYVFNTERRRVFSYARALNVAINEGITVAAFAEWVAEQGVEEVASTKGKTEESNQREALLAAKIEEARDLLLAKLLRPLAVITRSVY